MLAGVLIGMDGRLLRPVPHRGRPGGETRQFRASGFTVRTTDGEIRLSTVASDHCEGRDLACQAGPHTKPVDSPGVLNPKYCELRRRYRSAGALSGRG